MPSKNMRNNEFKFTPTFGTQQLNHTWRYVMCWNRLKYFTIVFTLCASILFTLGCRRKDSQVKTNADEDKTLAAQSIDTINTVDKSNSIDTVNLSYEEIVGSQISEFQKPQFSKLNTGESRYIVSSKDGLVSLELFGTLTKVHKISIGFSISTSDVEQYTILLTVNPILANILSISSSFINKWHEDIMTRAANEISNKDVATIYDIVNGRRIEYKVWKNLGMVLITL